MASSAVNSLGLDFSGNTQKSPFADPLAPTPWAGGIKKIANMLNPVGTAYAAGYNNYGVGQTSQPPASQPPPSGGAGGTGGAGGNVGDTRFVDGQNQTWNGSQWQSMIDEQSAQARNAINSGYDAYFGQLDQMLNQGLPDQRTAQEGIVTAQRQKGLDTAQSQFTEGQTDLGAQRRKAESSQAKTLGDISNNIRNLFQAGNVYLGARGAGDSSAANQYAYALTKLGSQQRGDVTSQYAEINNDIGDREFKLKNIYDTEVKNLESDYNAKINSVAQWFAEQQNSLRMAKGQGEVSKGQDLSSLSQNLLNIAVQQLNQVQQEASNRRSALEEWAMNNSTNINQLKQNLAAVSQTSYNMPGAQPIAGAPQVDSRGNLFAGVPGSTNDDTRTNIFGARIA